MATRQQAFTVYNVAYGWRQPTTYQDDALTLASALGVIDAARALLPSDIGDLERRLRDAGMLSDSGADARAVDAAEEDAALTRAGAAEVRRQLDIAQSQARSNRELHEAAVADVLELRCDRDDLRLLLANVRDALGAPAGEALTITADRVMRELQSARTIRAGIEADRDVAVRALEAVRAALGARPAEPAEAAARRALVELQQAKEALVQARAKCDELRRIVTGAEERQRQDDAAIAHLRGEVGALGRQVASMNSERDALIRTLGVRSGETLTEAAARAMGGAADMRERAAMVAHDARSLMDAERDIRALPLDSAIPAEEVRQGGERPGPWFRCDVKSQSAAEVEALRSAGFTWTTPGGWLCPRDGRQVLRWIAAGILATRYAVDPTAFWQAQRADTPYVHDTVHASVQPAEGLSAEDAETLRGDGWAGQHDGLWFKAHARGCDPMDHGLFDPRSPQGIKALRERAARIRARKPAAAHGEPEEKGEAPSGDHAATGSSSVAEQQGAAQGERCERVYSIGDPKWVGCMTHAEPDSTCPIWKMRRAPEAQYAPLPKPSRVEVGQRWQVDYSDLGQGATGCTVDMTNDTHARLQGDDGVVRYRAQSEILTSLRWIFLGPAPAPQGPDGAPEDTAGDKATPIYGKSKAAGFHAATIAPPWHGMEHETQPHRSDLDTWVVEAIDMAGEGAIYAAHFSGPHAEARAREYAALMSAPVPPSGGKDELANLSERRRRAYAVSSAAADATEPTARDAVAGMLLRYGFDGLAWDIACDRPAQEVIAAMRRGPIDDARVPSARPCIAALEALDRGELRVGPGYVSWNLLRTAMRRALGAGESESTELAAERVKRERDEARAEASLWEALCLENKAKAERAAAERDALREQLSALGYGVAREGQPGTETVFDVNRKTRLTFPRGAGAREVLATVVELLGITVTPAGDEDRDLVRTATPEELEAEAMRRAVAVERGSGWLWGCAAGIREGERRARSALNVVALEEASRALGVEEGKALVRVELDELRDEVRTLKGEIESRRAKLDELDAEWQRVTGCASPGAFRAADFGSAVTDADVETLARGARYGADKAAALEREKARATAQGLVDRWEGLIELDARDLEHGDEDAAANARGWVRCRGVCIRDLRAAFGLAPGSGPGGCEREPANSSDPADVSREELRGLADMWTQRAQRQGRDPDANSLVPGDINAAPWRSAAPAQPELGAGQVWRDRGNFRVTMRRRADISAGFNLDAVYDTGVFLQFNAGERAPYGWMLEGHEPREPDDVKVFVRPDGWFGLRPAAQQKEAPVSSATSDVGDEVARLAGLALSEPDPESDCLCCGSSMSRPEPELEPTPLCNLCAQTVVVALAAEVQRRGGAGPVPEVEAPAPPDREALGRAVHEAAQTSIVMRADWEHLAPASREWRCEVGEHLFAMGVRWAERAGCGPAQDAMIDRVRTALGAGESELTLVAARRVVSERDAFRRAAASEKPWVDGIVRDVRAALAAVPGEDIRDAAARVARGRDELQRKFGASGQGDTELAELARLIDDGRHAEASALIERVAARRGEEDAHVVAARWELKIASAPAAADPAAGISRATALRLAEDWATRARAIQASAPDNPHGLLQVGRGDGLVVAANELRVALGLEPGSRPDPGEARRSFARAIVGRLIGRRRVDAEDERAATSQINASYNCGRKDALTVAIEMICEAAGLEPVEGHSGLDRGGMRSDDSPQCCGEWLSGSGGHRMFGGGCDRPVLFRDGGADGGVYFCEKHVEQLDPEDRERIGATDLEPDPKPCATCDGSGEVSGDDPMMTSATNDAIAEAVGRGSLVATPGSTSQSPTQDGSSVPHGSDSHHSGDGHAKGRV